MAEELEKILNDEAAMNAICKEAFEEVDKDKSGEIDESELEAIMKDISKKIKIDPPTKEDVKDILNSLDSDHSGKLSLKEFSKFMHLILSAALQALKEGK